MKRLIVFLSLIHFCAFSQYKKLPLDTNHYWHEVYYYYQTYLMQCDYQYNVLKDTLIAGKIYKKVGITSKTGICTSGFFPPNKAFLREDTLQKKVYVLDNSYTERKLYDFSKNVGDTLNLYSMWGFCMPNTAYTYTVASIDSLILNDGKYHRRHKYNYGIPVIIEGVGGEYGLLTPFCSQGYGTGTNLICAGTLYPTNTTLYHVNGTTYSCSVVSGLNSNSTNETAITIYPNPASVSIKILDNNASVNYTSIEIIDLGGRVIMTKTLDHEIEINTLEPGYYLVKLKDKNDRIIPLSFIKQ